MLKALQKIASSGSGVLALHAMLFLYLFSPYLFGGLVFSHTDALMGSYPTLAFMKMHVFSRGVFWDDLSAQGFPSPLLYGTGFQLPLHIFLLFFTPFSALHWTMYLYATGGAYFCSMTLVLKGFSRIAGFIAGAIFPLTLWSWVFVPEIYAVIPLLGLFFYAITRFAKQPSVAAVCSMFLWTAGFLCLLPPYAAMFAVVTMGYCILQWRQTASRFKGRNHFAWMMLLAAGCSLFFSAIRWLPLLAYGLLSPLGGLHALGQWPWSAGIGSGYFLQYLFPETPFPFASQGASILPYIGSIPLAFVCIGILTFWKKKDVQCLVALFLLSIAVALPYSPALWLLLHIPFVSYLGEPPRYLFLGTLALVPLIAYGVDATVSGKERQIQKGVAYGFLFIGLLAFCASLTATLLPVYYTFVREHAWLHWLLVLQSPYRLDNPKNYFPVLMLLGTGPLFLLYLTKRIPVHRKQFFLGGVSVTMTFIVFFTMTMRWGEARYPFDTPTSVITHLQHTGGLAVGYATAKTSQALMESRGAKSASRTMQTSLLLPERHLQWGISNASIFNHLQSIRMARLLSVINVEMPHKADAIVEALRQTTGQDMDVLRRYAKLIDVLRIKHIVSTLPLMNLGYHLEWLEELYPSDKFPRTAAVWTLYGTLPEGGTAVFENTDVLPLASVPSTALLQEPDADSAYEHLLDPTRTTDTAIIECVRCSGTVMAATGALVAIITDAQLETTVAVSAPAPVWTVISRPLLPGWHVFLDGRRTEPALAQTVYAAVLVPAGTHTVSMTFSLFSLLDDSARVVLSPGTSLWLQKNPQKNIHYTGRPSDEL